MSPDEKIKLLDEVVATAIASWRIYIVVDAKFSTWADDERNTPEYEGCCTLKVLLCHSLMSACYASMDQAKTSYSLHRAIADPDLVISPEAKEKFGQCKAFWPKIAKYRNNVTAHVNLKRTQSEWADFANIKNGEIDAFMKNARIIVEELCKANLGVRNLSSSRNSFQKEFRDFCRVVNNG